MERRGLAAGAWQGRRGPQSAGQADRQRPGTMAAVVAAAAAAARARILQASEGGVEGLRIWVPFAHSQSPSFARPSCASPTPAALPSLHPAQNRQPDSPPSFHSRITPSRALTHSPPACPRPCCHRLALSPLLLSPQELAVLLTSICFCYFLFFLFLFSCST